MNQPSPSVFKVFFEVSGCTVLYKALSSCQCSGSDAILCKVFCQCDISLLSMCCSDAGQRGGSDDVPVGKRLAMFPTGTEDPRVRNFLSTLNINDRFFFSHTITE